MASKKKAPRNTSEEYDENGRWKLERNKVKGCMRQAFRLSPQMQDVMQDARRELPPKLKKNGEPGKRNQVRYHCAICDGLFSQKFVVADHIEPVVPIYKREADMDHNEMAKGIFCKLENLQVVCAMTLKANNGLPSCHKKKSDLENFLRTKLVARGAKPEDDSYDTLIDKFTAEFQIYLAEKERKALAKIERKRLRDEKEEKRIKELKNKR